VGFNLVPYTEHCVEMQLNTEPNFDNSQEIIEPNFDNSQEIIARKKIYMEEGGNEQKITRRSPNYKSTYLL
jgi:hypothetical protein